MGDKKMGMIREAIEYFKFMRKIMCEDHLKICPKDSIAYQATLKEKEFYDMAIKALEQEPTTKNDLALIHTEGLDEEIRCTMCTNSMKSDRGCDGNCVVNKDMYKAVMDAMEKRIQPITRNCFGCKYSKDNHNAGTEECHLCMWENQYTPTTENDLRVDCIDRTELLKAMDTWPKFGVDSFGYMHTLTKDNRNDLIPYVHYGDVISCIKGMSSVTPCISSKVCEHDRVVTLDKIREEIKQTSSRYVMSRERGYEGQVEWSDRLIKESEVLGILDKYKAESEE